MNKHAKKVFDALKPKASKFGFNKKELQSIAKEIADNLTLDDDATDEDVEEEINKSVDAFIPILKYGQVLGNRLLDKYKAEHAIDDDDNDDDDDNSDDDSDVKSKKNKSGKGNSNEEEMPAYMKAFMAKFDAMNVELAALKGEKVTDARRAQLEDILKDTGTFEKTTLRQFKRMTFEDDEAFEDFLDEIKEDAEKIKQEIADAKLKSSKPNAIDEGDDTVVTDDFIKDLVK